MLFLNLVLYLYKAEFHPLLQQNELINFCKTNSMIFQAYSSLGTSNLDTTKQLKENEMICSIADKYSKKPAQILLKWAIQKDICNFYFILKVI